MPILDPSQSNAPAVIDCMNTTPRSRLTRISGTRGPIWRLMVCTPNGPVIFSGRTPNEACIRFMEHSYRANAPTPHHLLTTAIADAHSEAIA